MVLAAPLSLSHPMPSPPRQDTSKWLHYNFSTTLDIVTGYPMRDCGTTIPYPPWAYACTHHKHVLVAAQYSVAEWAHFFDLDTSKCTPKPVNVREAALGATTVPGIWPGALRASPRSQ